MKTLLFLPFYSLLFFSFSFLHFLSPSHTISIVFYNVENLFDPENDPEKNDDDFTHTGFYHWTYKKFYKKLNDIAKVLLSINGWEPPDLIGLAEIENDNALKKLCYFTGLKTYQYKYVHYDSPDNRGIEVALLYRKDRVTILESNPIPIIFPFESNAKNRDILFVKALVFTDTLHLFVNHWTSRFGGEGVTIPKRNYYAQVLKSYVDSLLSINKNNYIVILGDFNDYPTDESMTQYLQAKNYLVASRKQEAEKGKGEMEGLYNLMFPFVGKNIGTHKTQEFWGCLDQIIVSKSLLDKQNRLQVVNGSAEIYNASFLLVDDEKYGGMKPFRTYLGPKYLGGYSDHLPVKIRIERL